MAHDGSDGSRYDIVDPLWDADAMFLRLEAALGELASATLETRPHHEAIVEGIRYDLRALHGIDI